LIRAAALAGAEAVRAREWTPEERERCRQKTRALGLDRNVQPGYHGPLWTPAQLRLLGTEADEVIAARISRTPNAVRVKRTRLHIPTARDRGRRE
jgi:hypothetical protein